MGKNFMSAMIETKASTPQPTYSQTERVKKNITILESIKKFIPPLLPEEKKQLEQNILEFGCKDPIIIWETNKGVIDATSQDSEELLYILIDGHNRYEICQKFKVDFKISVVEFENLDKVHDFMIDHQLGRRNLSPEQMSYLRGLKYNSLKKNNVQRDKSGKFQSENLPSGQNDQPENLTGSSVQLPDGQNDHSVRKISLSEKLAEQFNVGEKTIRRDADFARGLDLLPTDLKNKVLQGKANFNKTDIIEIGKLKDEKRAEEVAKDILNKVDKEEKLTEKRENSTNKTKEKIISFAKSMNTIDDCDKLIKMIIEYKKTIQY
ncbi:hypothetical protein [Emticicia sp. 17c]|uniref:hypothetical protein n=1 Tax=Emticicia sp. 17c TaxID=3127704 RepID=UPI00301C09CC